MLFCSSSVDCMAWLSFWVVVEMADGLIYYGFILGISCPEHCCYACYFLMSVFMDLCNPLLFAAALVSHGSWWIL